MRCTDHNDLFFLCLTQDSDLAALLGKTAEAYDNEREDV